MSTTVEPEQKDKQVTESMVEEQLKRLRLPSIEDGEKEAPSERLTTKHDSDEEDLCSVMDRCLGGCMASAKERRPAFKTFLVTSRHRRSSSKSLLRKSRLVIARRPKKLILRPPRLNVVKFPDLEDPAVEEEHPCRTSRNHQPTCCSQQALNPALVEEDDVDDTTVEELAAYFDCLVHIPKKMSQMAEMMYT